MYAELHCLSNFSFQRGASHPRELVLRARELGYAAIAITDECSLAGVVKAHVAARECGIHLVIGSELNLEEGIRLVALAPCRTAYSELSGLISMARRRCPKGEYRATLRDVIFHLKRCLLIWLPEECEADGAGFEHGQPLQQLQQLQRLQRLCRGRLWLGITHLYRAGEQRRHARLHEMARRLDIPMVACGDVQMHHPGRKALHDVLTAIRHNTVIGRLGRRRLGNGQHCLRGLEQLRQLYPATLLEQTLVIAGRCGFSLDELRYEYPREVVPAGHSPLEWLRHLVAEGARRRWPGGVSAEIQGRIETELALVEELRYEYYFLTVHDIVRFARERGILCQGRGSAANSVVCYCLHITEVSPEQVSLLFERFISRERNEPPDIDVDFEHERREEVIQYIYTKYTRRRAALAATVITYRARSAVRDVGKALGMDPVLVDDLARSLTWWDSIDTLRERLSGQRGTAQLFHGLVRQIIGFPRHLSQHVGGFVITDSPISTLVPVENAGMEDRTVIQWDKEDIEALGLLKVDVLALGMLSAIRKSLQLVHRYAPEVRSIQDIPQEDAATYRMLQAADSVGVFQVESRAQMSMLPRLRPATFHDLVIQIAIVRPGPIQGDMVHPYLRRRQGREPVTYPGPAIESVLQRTLGIPIFQEQAISLAMVAAGFSGGEADQLRRAMASWGKNGDLSRFETRLVEGMLERGYSEDFARRLFEQIKGFGGYGFPESHSASFALLAYVSAWFKCHHPAAFYCGLLNSQPMGFYSPSQLVQDARRHGVEVLPVDVEHSEWDHGLGDGSSPALRLGFRLVRGLGEESVARIVRQRRRRAFADVGDLRWRARLRRDDMEALADADALANLAGHRHQSRWRIMGVEEKRPLLENDTRGGRRDFDDGVTLPAPALGGEVLADYHSTGLSLRPHPLSLLRRVHPFDRCLRQRDLATLGDKRFVRIAGLVTGRQRPGTASGVIFLTLEDETGNSNVVVWPRVQQRFRKALLSARLLLVKGVLESRDGVVHIIAATLFDYSHHLRDLPVASRNFH